MAMIDLRKAATLLFSCAMLALAGCGGGGGGTSAGSGTGGSTGGKTTLTVTMAKVSDGTTTNSVAYGSPVKVSGKLVNAQNLAVANALVTFTISSSDLLTMTPTGGTALTDANGVASIIVNSASLTASGAGTITATATVNTVSVTGTANFQVGAPDVTLSQMVIGQSPLSPYGTTSVQVTVNIAGSPATTPMTVGFSSLCSVQGKATLPATVQTVNGLATATYQDNGCGSADTVTATVTVGTTVTRTGQIVVQPPGVASVQFVSATPATIVLKGTGAAGMQENSIVTFKVVDQNNQPMPNTNVLLDLTTRSGGILLDNSAVAITKQTNASGVVQVSVQAGTNPTPVWVKATVTASGNTYTSQSTQLTISTGRPAQDRFSLSAATHAIEGLNYDGVTTSVTAIASDRMGNRVPDGTGINFISSGGQIQSSCTTTAGQCSVTFTSANPRPRGVAEPSAVAVSAGRVLVTAYTLGEESFVDLNGDNVYQSGEAFNDLGNVYVDANENGAYDVGEQVVQYNAGNALACAAGIATSPSAPTQAGTCDGIWGQAHVRQSQVIVMSGSHANANNARPVSGYTPSTTYSMGGACQGTATFWLFDDNKNPMPAGTTIAVASVPDGVSASIVNVTVPDSTYPGGTTHAVKVTYAVSGTTCAASPPVGPAASAFAVTLSATTPKGNGTLFSLSFTP